MRPLRAAARGGLCLGPEHLEGSRRDWGDAGSGGGGIPLDCMSPTLSPGTQAGLASLGKRRPVGACASQLSQSQCKGRGSGLPGCPPLPDCSRTHLDPAVIPILNPRADDQLAVGFRRQVRHVFQKLLI